MFDLLIKLLEKNGLTVFEIILFLLIFAALGYIVKLLYMFLPEIKEIKKEQYRASLWNNSLSLSERIDAGRKYIEAGGNGGSKIKLELLEEELRKKMTRKEEIYKQELKK